MVAEYLDRLLPEGWEDMDTYSRRQWLETNAQGTIRRTTVCTLEVWAEALGGNPDKLDRYGVKEVCDIMSSLPEWVRQGNRQRTFKPYGRQKFFMRRGSL